VPRVSEVHRSGHLLFDAVLGKQYQSYRAFRLPWSGRPSEMPAIAVTRAGREVKAYASWNGATDVHSWQLLAGPRAAELRPVSSAPARSFESALTSAASAGPCFAARALDASGGLLAQSGAVPVRS
jgi:hypothetical protein